MEDTGWLNLFDIGLCMVSCTLGFRLNMLIGD